MARQPISLMQAGLGLMGELFRIGVGQSALSPEPSDKRFSDPAWRQSWFHRRLLKSYLAWARALQSYAHDSSSDPRESQPAGFLMSQIIDAMAPTNALLLYPAASKRFIETGGDSMRPGLANMFDDIGKGSVIPSQSDDRLFKVGENLAATPGVAVLRTETFELMQYTPQTEAVFERPMLFIPALVNKFYVLDLAPGRSLFEHFIKSGVTLLTAWRNPPPEHHHWGIEEYQDAIDKAITVVLEITGAEDLNLWGVCGASPIVVSVLGYYTATRQRKVNSLGLLVPILDLATLRQMEGIGPFVGQKSVLPRAKKRPRRMSSRELGLLFALLRSNDLIWNYWVSNYLMEEDPPIFDVLTWNNDGTGMTAKTQRGFRRDGRRQPARRAGREESARRTDGGSRRARDRQPCGGCRDRPYLTLGIGLSLCIVARRAPQVRAWLFRAYSDPGLPARKSEVGLLHEPCAPRVPRAVAGEGDQACGHLVGRLHPLAR